ncbi:MAG: IS1 family transposase [Magnetococcales bacterium]|nr:IS1 family transposase [Magnetococcales bacterium]
MAFTPIHCPDCNSQNVVKYGKQPNGEQRYICHNPECSRRVFLLNYRIQTKKSPPRNPIDRSQIIELALEGNDVAETAHLLGIPEQTVADVFQMLSRFQAPTPRSIGKRKPQPRALAG